jgi:hypothetical protein
MIKELLPAASISSAVKGSLDLSSIIFYLFPDASLNIFSEI